MKDFSFLNSCNFTFLPNEYTGLYQHRPGNSFLGKRSNTNSKLLWRRLLNWECGMKMALAAVYTVNVIFF